MDFEIGLGAAFIAGLLSFASPCVLPLVPPYLCYLAGVSIGQLKGEEPAPGASRQVLLSALAFVAGFSLIFIAFGATATAFGKAVQHYFDWLSLIAGIAIMVMGLHFLGLLRIGLLYRDAHINVSRKPAGIAGAFVMGLAFAFGWTPCVGPVLAAILFAAGGQETVSEGVKLLSAYSLGIGVPFLAAAAFAGPFMTLVSRFRRHMGAIEKLIGVLLVLTGILFVTGGMNAIALLMLEYLPGLGRVG
ncbi:MAG: cytochrome c biogenesis protein CcdA [Methyloligellaceae bacterium]